jgi:MOSC domain-containing protein YiiM
MVNNEVGNVIALYISISGESQRTLKNKLVLEKGGVVGDKFFGKDNDREVLITTTDSYLLAQKNDIALSQGALGENILIDYNLYDLAIGQKLQIGTVVFEISLYCPICNHLSRIKKGLPKLLKNDRGIFARVIDAGEINLGDKIILL